MIFIINSKVTLSMALLAKPMANELNIAWHDADCHSACYSTCCTRSSVGEKLGKVELAY